MKRYHPTCFADRFAWFMVCVLRRPRDWFFGKRYAHHALVLETVAAIPGLVGGALLHLRCLRRIRDDEGWIQKLLDEAQNEYRHLMTFREIAEPTRLESFLIKVGQWCFLIFYTFVYLISPSVAHRFVGYLEEEAVASYQEYLRHLENNADENVLAPKIAHTYWSLSEKARLSDVVCVIISEEEEHRDVNHEYATLLRKVCKHELDQGKKAKKSCRHTRKTTNQ